MTFKFCVSPATGHWHGYVCPVPWPEAGRRIYGRSQTAAQDPLSRSAIIMMSFTGPGPESGEAAPTSRGPAAPPRLHAPPLEVRRKPEGPWAPEAGGLRPAGRQKTRTRDRDPDPSRAAKARASRCSRGLTVGPPRPGASRGGPASLTGERRREELGPGGAAAAGPSRRLIGRSERIASRPRRI